MGALTIDIMMLLKDFKCSTKLLTGTLRYVSIVVFILCEHLFQSKMLAAEQALSKSASETTSLKAKALKARHEELNKQLLKSLFKRPLYLYSEEAEGSLKGEIYAVVDYPFATFNLAFNNPAHWCNALILNINVKYCHMKNNQDGNVMLLNMGKKTIQPLNQTYRIVFNYKETISTPNYFPSELDSKNGPLGTYDYRILIEATPLNDGQTFLHFTYAYSFGVTGRLAMQTYLATIGRNKVGFTYEEKLSEANATNIKGIRGLVERNTMRYYLAIESYLASMAHSSEQQFEYSLQHWYNGSEQYALQLHEVEKNDYFDMKRSELIRQQVAQ